MKLNTNYPKPANYLVSSALKHVLQIIKCAHRAVPPYEFHLLLLLLPPTPQQNPNGVSLKFVYNVLKRVLHSIHVIIQGRGKVRCRKRIGGWFFNTRRGSPETGRRKYKTHDEENCT